MKLMNGMEIIESRYCITVQIFLLFLLSLCLSVALSKDRNHTVVDEVTLYPVSPSLHSHLVEHLNAEIVLQTISDVNMALDWIRSTFLYIRALKNPTHYGQSTNIPKMIHVRISVQHLCHYCTLLYVKPVSAVYLNSHFRFLC